jgi:hypothetical protein
MSEKRILTVNPDLFSFSNNKTRKKKEKPPDGKIKVKSQSSQKREDTLKKKSILKMIREHQEEKLKKMFAGDNNAVRVSPKSTSLVETKGSTKTEFQEAKEFLQQLTQKNDDRRQNSTLKRHSATIPALSLPTLPSITEMPNAHFARPSLPISTMEINPSPAWGCLKGGTLPTYRTYTNQTRKNYPTQALAQGQPQVQVPVPAPQNTSLSTIPTQHKSVPTPQAVMDAGASQKRMEDKIKESLSRVEQSQQTGSLMKQMKQALKVPKKMKRKKTLRRTYKIGRSKVFPRVSVLVSNRTLRNNITTKTQQLKQVPIHEVKSYLIKRGLIKVGSMAPNDVLRKMYESASLICGEVQNHNPENLLYNYLNDKSG